MEPAVATKMCGLSIFTRCCNKNRRDHQADDTLRSVFCVAQKTRNVIALDIYLVLPIDRDTRLAKLVTN